MTEDTANTAAPSLEVAPGPHVSRRNWTTRWMMLDVLIALVLTRWMTYARVVRAEVLKLRKLDYVRAARVVGGSPSWIISRHLLPALGGVLVSLLSVELASTILSESSLSYLGLGVQPPDTSLGLLVAQGSEYINSAPWLALAPGLVLFLIMLSAALTAQAVGEKLNPLRRASWRR